MNGQFREETHIAKNMYKVKKAHSSFKNANPDIELPVSKKNLTNWLKRQ